MVTDKKEGGTIYVAVYRPHKGKEADLQALVKTHVPTLRRLKLVTDRPEVVMKAKDGSFIEVCEWATPDSSRQAHEHPEVKKIWEAMGEVADFPGLGELEEAKAMFAHFEPVNF